MTEDKIAILNESIEKLETAKKLIMRKFALLAVTDEFTTYFRTFTIIMIFNRAVNLVDAIEDAARKRNILVQTALMRMMADLPMTAYRVKLLGAEEFIKRIIKKEHLNYGKAPNGESLMDAKVKKQVAKDFEDFDKFYDWACKGVHFSELDQMASLRANSEATVDANIAVGMNDAATFSAIIINNDTTKKLVDIMLSAVKKYILSLEKGEKI